jgi:hypothetical protein
VRAGIFHNGKWGHVRIICNVKWMNEASVRGIVIWPFILFSERAEDIEKWIFRHELQHAYQVMRLGRLRFYWLYFLASLRYGYFENPFEIEAREYQYSPLTHVEEQLLWKLKEQSLSKQTA